MEYMQKVKIRLIEMGKTQKWLYDEVKTKTGLFCDNSYLAKISKGKRKSPQVVKVINEILGFEEGEHNAEHGDRNKAD